MLPRPYQCPRCNNWYTPQVKQPDDACIYCLESKHAAHPKTGVVDCHFMEYSAMPSERALQETVFRLSIIADAAEGAVAVIENAKSDKQVNDILVKAEEHMTEAERLQGQVQELLTWAAVMEMPGHKGDRAEDRYKHRSAIISMVDLKRRPQSDLDRLDYSVKVSSEIANEIPTLMARVRMGIGRVRSSAERWAEPVQVTAAPLIEKPKPAMRKRRGPNKAARAAA
jgi:hypothetical protein